MSIHMNRRQPNQSKGRAPRCGSNSRNVKAVCLAVLALVLATLSCTEQEKGFIETQAAQAAQTAAILIKTEAPPVQTQLAAAAETAVAQGINAVKTQAQSLVETEVARVKTEVATRLPPIFPTTAPRKPILDYFALGDSIASGHGLMDEGGACRRSWLSYPAKVALSPTLSARYLVNFPVSHFLACTGATAYVKDAASCAGDNRYKCFHNQYEDLLPLIRDNVPTLVSITIGANDTRWADWMNIGNTVILLESPLDTYLGWANEVGASIAEELRADLGPLFDKHPNVMVVITQIHNPINQESIFFLGPVGVNSCKIVFGLMDCFQKTEYGVGALNNALAGVALDRTDRVRLAIINPAFHKHASTCGFASVAETWIQLPGDATSNSKPFVPEWFRTLTPTFPWPWTGDCFHPNEQGARAYADAVVEAFLNLNR